MSDRTPKPGDMVWCGNRLYYIKSIVDQPELVGFNLTDGNHTFFMVREECQVLNDAEQKFWEARNIVGRMLE